MRSALSKAAKTAAMARSRRGPAGAARQARIGARLVGGLEGGLVAGVIIGALGGCSLLLDFDSAPPLLPPDECAYGEPNDTRESATLLVPGEAVAAAICRPDVVDYYAVEIPAGRITTRIDLRFVQSGVQGNLDMRLFDSDGRTRASSLSIDNDEQIRCPSPTCEDLPVGTYILEVREEITSSTGVRYQLELTAR